MSARDWRSLLSDAPGPFALVDSMRDYLTSHFEVWTYDQVQWYILNTNICDFPLSFLNFVIRSS